MKLFTFLVLSLLAFTSIAQDRVVGINNEVIFGKILEISNEEVIIDALKENDTINLIISTGLISYIEFSNGEKIYYSEGNLNSGLTANNVLYLTDVGILGLNLNYERYLFSLGRNTGTSFWIKTNAGIWNYNFLGLFDFERYSLSCNLSTLFFSGSSNHIELNYGIVNFFKGGIRPSFSMGYRFQQPGKGLVIRTGLSFPDIFYFSLGYNF